MDYVHIEADVTLFQNANQLNVRRIRTAREGEYVEADYLPVSKKEIGKMYEELLGFCAQCEESMAESAFVRVFCGR